MSITHDEARLAEGNHFSCRHLPNEGALTPRLRIGTYHIILVTSLNAISCSLRLVGIGRLN
ncbi:hypothetical protein BDW59DRAFT_143967 [Aspergillus cavernicola]|uniref:Uncharacterized protein n=1 Tax=Aspergillus cavernicola TaxID=176166 RepID=A0ABR4IIF2_9EURO